MSIWWPGPWGAGIMGGTTKNSSLAESPHQAAIATPEPEEEKEPVCPMPTPKKRARLRKEAIDLHS